MLHIALTGTLHVDGAAHPRDAALALGQAVTAPAPSAVLALTGAWRGALYPSDSHTGLPFSIVLEATPEGLSAGRFAFTSTMIPRAEAKLLEAGDASFVLLIGPYYDPYIESDMLTRVEGRRAGDRIFGELYTSKVSGERTAFARFMASRGRGSRGAGKPAAT